MDADSDDPRHDELSSLLAIFPEIEPDEKNPYRFSIELPVHPAKPVTVTFPAASNADVPAANQIPGAEPRVDSHELSHLPAVVVRISLPQGYPSEKPPSVNVSTSPPWLSADVAKKLEDDGPRLWEEMGRDLVAFTYIDHVQQAADDVFGMVDGDGALEIDPLHKIAILDYDIEASRAAFAKETFECGVCLDPKKGSVCHKLLDCGHIFCIQCLQEFYNNAITEGDLATVRCLAPNCAKERAGKTKKRKAKTGVSPSELLQIGLTQEMVTRFVTLKYKNELESDKNTIYCPRSWCNGAARSKKHKKPEGLEVVESSDEDDEDEDTDADANDEAGGAATTTKKKKKTFDVGDLLAICEDCGFAFCSRCYQSWHGEFYRCTPKRDKGEISAEEQASIDYINLHTTPCPTCGVPAQKTHGCNHMICFRCASHFCYLCSAWLDPHNPYSHFNEQPNGKVTSCYMRLWELEGGDGDDVDVGFAGGMRPAAAAAEDEGVEIIDIVPEIEEPDDTDSEVDANEDDQRPRPPAGGVAREGPLVLRIGADPAPRGGRAGAAAGVGQGPVPPAAPPAPAPRRGGHPARGGRGGRGNRGGAAARGGRRQNQAQRAGAEGGEFGLGPQGEGELDPLQEAWIRHFVQMALIDQEDDSDEEWPQH